MTIETEIRARLASDGAVAGLIGGRIYPLKLPQQPTYPALTYNRVSGPRLHDLQGSARRAMPRITINSWAEDYDVALVLAQAVRLCLDGFIGRLTTLQATIRIENEIDLFEDEAGTGGVYRILQDYMINHSEPAALDYGSIAAAALISIDHGAIATAATASSDYGPV